MTMLAAGRRDCKHTISGQTHSARTTTVAWRKPYRTGTVRDPPVPAFTGTRTRLISVSLSFVCSTGSGLPRSPAVPEPLNFSQPP